MTLDPEHVAHNVHLHLGLCKVSIRLGRGKDGLNICNEALVIDPELIEALHRRGEAKVLLEDWEGAVEDLKHATQNSQNMEIHEALGKAEKALKMSKRMIEVCTGRLRVTVLEFLSSSTSVDEL